ncbi:MAG TPA: OmpH family outer membrane protein [Sphingomonas sp.]
MTKLFKTALFVATSAVSLAAAAPALADSTVLVVDFDQVFQNSAAGKSGTSQLSAKYQPIINQRQAAFTAAAQSYNSQVDAAKKAAKPGVQPPQATMTAIQQAGERAQAAQNALQQTQDEVNQVAGFVRSQIVDHAGPVAEQIRAEKKAAVVISKSAALASDPADDVTTTLIQRLDAAFPTPSIAVPQQAAGPQGSAQGR